MPRQTDLARADVFSAIEQQLAAGAYPTAARLRELLGQRGSPVVLQRFLRDWYSDHGAAFAAKVVQQRKAGGDPGIRQQLEAATREAIAQFDAHQAEVAAQLAARAATLDATEADLAQRQSRQDVVEQAHQEMIADLRASLQQAGAERDATRLQCVEIQTHLAAAQAVAESLSKQVVELQHGVAGAATVRAELVAARENQQQLRGQVVALSDQLRRLLGQLDTAGQATTAERSRADKLAEQLSEARVAMVEAREARAAAAATLEATQRALASAEAGQATGTGQALKDLAAARSELSALHERLVGLETALVGPVQQLADDALARRLRSDEDPATEPATPPRRRKPRRRAP